MKEMHFIDNNQGNMEVRFNSYVSGESGCYVICINGIDLLAVEPTKGHVWNYGVTEEEAEKLKAKGFELDEQNRLIVEKLL